MRGSDSMKKNDISKIIWLVVQIVTAFLFIVPLLWMIVSSFKVESEIFKDMTSIKSLFLLNPTLDNYKEMFSRVPIFLYIINNSCCWIICKFACWLRVSKIAISF